MIVIEKVENGYIIKDGLGFTSRATIHFTVQSLFEDLLQRLEGRCKHFRGDLFGQVTVLLTEPKSEG